MVTFCAGATNAPAGTPVVFVVMTHVELQRFTSGEACVLPMARVRDTLERSGFKLEQCHALTVCLARPGENEFAIAARIAGDLGGQGAECTVIDRRANGAGEN